MEDDGEALPGEIPGALMVDHVHGRSLYLDEVVIIIDAFALGFEHFKREYDRCVDVCCVFDKATFSIGRAILDSSRPIHSVAISNDRFWPLSTASNRSSIRSSS